LKLHAEREMLRVGLKLTFSQIYGTGLPFDSGTGHLNSSTSFI